MEEIKAKKFIQITGSHLKTSNAVCEHCGQEQAHDVLGDNGKCDTCNKLVRKGLF